MKKRILPLLTLLLATGNTFAQDKVITLNLKNPTTALEFDKDNGSWTGTYNDDSTSITSQCFTFMKGSMGEYFTWWGFTASKSADNSPRTNYIKYQYSNMAKGGIALDEAGKVKKDERGAVVIDPEMPYLVAYYMPYMSKRPLSMTFADGKSYKPVGMYINLNNWSYYTVAEGTNAMARAFTEGDSLTLTVHGVAADQSEKNISAKIASYSNGNLTVSRGWQYVDLSSLGTVNEIYFTVKTTDVGTYGDNTPTYFCLDKLMVMPAEDSGINNILANTSLSYFRDSHLVKASGFVAVYDIEGRSLISSENGELDCTSLDPGIYVARCGNKCLKFIR